MTQSEGQRPQNQPERVIYQPEYDEGLWKDMCFYSFMAFRTETECRRVFPTLKPIRYEEDEIEELKAQLSRFMTDHGPLVSQEDTVAFSESLSTDQRQVEPKQLIVAINALAYRD